MKKLTPNEVLSTKISLLERKRQRELEDLKKQFHLTYDAFKPINLIKDGLKDITQSIDLNKGFSSAAIGITSGYIIKNILFRKSSNPLKNLVGVAVETFIANLAAKNSDKIKTSTVSLFEQIMAMIKKPKKLFSENEIYE